MNSTCVCHHGVAMRSAFTLVEVLLALAISAIIGLAVAGMLGGMGYAVRSEYDTRRVIIKRQVAATRLGSLTRGAALLLAADDGCLVLWCGDRSGDGLPNLSELRRIEHNPQTQEVWVYQSPDDLEATQDEVYALSEAFVSITGAQAGSERFPGKRVLSSIVELGIDHDGVTPESARLLRLEVSVAQEGVTDTATVISALRAGGD